MSSILVCRVFAIGSREVDCLLEFNRHISETIKSCLELVCSSGLPSNKVEVTLFPGLWVKWDLRICVSKVEC